MILESLYTGLKRSTILPSEKCGIDHYPIGSLGLGQANVIHRLELVPQLGEVDGIRVLLELAGLHLDERQILQVHATGEKNGTL